MPIGIVQVAAGGTLIGLWTSAEARSEGGHQTRRLPSPTRMSRRHLMGRARQRQARITCLPLSRPFELRLFHRTPGGGGVPGLPADRPPGSLQPAGRGHEYAQPDGGAAHARVGQGPSLVAGGGRGAHRNCRLRVLVQGAPASRVLLCFIPVLQRHSLERRSFSDWRHSHHHQWQRRQERGHISIG